MSVFQLLLPAFVAGLVLTGMLSYLGLHVVERGVIFVDLSLAQIAALGTTVAVLFGRDIHSTTAYLFSLGFTILGAATALGVDYAKFRKLEALWRTPDTHSGKDGPVEC